MILNVSARSLALLLAAGVASTTGSHLRQRRESLFRHDGEGAAEVVVKGGLRSAASASEDATDESPASEAAVAAAAGPRQQEEPTPSITSEKLSYSESEPISFTFSVGSPRHPFYSSSDAPSLNLNYDYPKWSVGLFMRDADPQGGTLAPIVSINACGARGDGCDAADRRYGSYTDVSVTFDEEHLSLMEGSWPLMISKYGTGYDAYVLDSKGAAAIGPLEFYIRDEEDADESTYQGGGSGKPTGQSALQKKLAGSSHGLMKYRKGTDRATERQHAAVSKSLSTNVAGAAHDANKKIERANGLEMSSGAIPESESIHKVEHEQGQESSKGSIESDKDEYEHDESVSITFSLDDASEGIDLSKYRIGIFMRMAHPQGGALEPVTSLPLCTDGGCDTAQGVASGSVTFSGETKELMGPGTWPIDLYQWGTGYDAYILDEGGDGVVGPVKFNIMMDDTY